MEVLHQRKQEIMKKATLGKPKIIYKKRIIWKVCMYLGIVFNCHYFQLIFSAKVCIY